VTRRLPYNQGELAWIDGTIFNNMMHTSLASKEVDFLSKTMGGK